MPADPFRSAQMALQRWHLGVRDGEKREMHNFGYRYTVKVKATQNICRQLLAGDTGRHAPAGKINVDPLLSAPAEKVDARTGHKAQGISHCALIKTSNRMCASMRERVC